MSFNPESYIYLPLSDLLVRRDFSNTLPKTPFNSWSIVLWYSQRRPTQLAAVGVRA